MKNNYTAQRERACESESTMHIIWTKTNEHNTQLMASVLESKKKTQTVPKYTYTNTQHRQANIWTTSKGSNEFVFFL